MKKYKTKHFYETEQEKIYNKTYITINIKQCILVQNNTT